MRVLIILISLLILMSCNESLIEPIEKIKIPIAIYGTSYDNETQLSNLEVANKENDFVFQKTGIQFRWATKLLYSKEHNIIVFVTCDNIYFLEPTKGQIIKEISLDYTSTHLNLFAYDRNQCLLMNGYRIYIINIPQKTFINKDINKDVIQAPGILRNIMVDIKRQEINSLASGYHDGIYLSSSLVKIDIPSKKTKLTKNLNNLQSVYFSDDYAFQYFSNHLLSYSLRNFQDHKQTKITIPANYNLFYNTIVEKNIVLAYNEVDNCFYKIDITNHNFEKYLENTTGMKFISMQKNNETSFVIYNDLKERDKYSVFNFVNNKEVLKFRSERNSPYRYYIID